MGSWQPEGSWRDSPVTLDSLVLSWPQWAPKWGGLLGLPNKNVRIVRAREDDSTPDWRYLAVVEDLAQELQLTRLGDVEKLLIRDELKLHLKKFIRRRVHRRSDVYNFSDDYLSMICMYIVVKNQLGHIPEEFAEFAPSDL